MKTFLILGIIRGYCLVMINRTFSRLALLVFIAVIMRFRLQLVNSIGEEFN